MIGRRQLYDDVDPYPRPRRDRGKGIPTNTQNPITASLPNVFNWALNLGCQTARRTTAASRRLVGPIFIDQLVLEAGNAGDSNPMALLQLMWQSFPYTEEQDAVITSELTGTSVWEKKIKRSDTTDPSSAEGTYYSHIDTRASVVFKIGQPITDPEVYLAMALRTAGAGSALRTKMMLRVLTNVDINVLGDLTLK